MKISNTIQYAGVNDHKVDLFEGQYVVPNGMAYNSYVILDDKIAVLDTVDSNFTDTWLDRIRDILGERKPDYLIIQHMEPDHSASLQKFMEVYPETVVVGNAKTFTMIANFFHDLDLEGRTKTVADGDVLSLGTHELHFLFAPMVHWPEVMLTYDAAEKVLFSADAFGKFGALDAEEDWACEARRYYFGIVGKYGAQVQALLKKASDLEIRTICPLHGPVLSENLAYYLNLYRTWSSYEPETEGIMVAYASIYGNTAKAARILADKLRSKGCPKVVLCDLAREDMAEAVEDAFRYNKLVLAASTYNGGVFPVMKQFIDALTERNYQNRTVGLIENGSWAPQAAKIMKSMLEKSKNLTWIAATATIRSAVKNTDMEQLEAMAEELCRNYEASANVQQPEAMFKIGYGLYVVTCHDGVRDNGLIVNTVSQVTSTPNRIAVTINKGNYSHHVISKTGMLNVNCLSVEAPFSVFQNFGFCSGRSKDKFAGMTPQRSENGLAVLPEYSNACLSLKVEQYVDLGTHGMFICSVTESRVLSDKETMTYSYYQEHVKPKPETKGRKGYVCKICGYVYEGEELPEDFVCPWCKHGASDFEPIA